jgi:hypothetical protein
MRAVDPERSVLLILAGLLSSGATILSEKRNRRINVAKYFGFKGFFEFGGCLAGCCQLSHCCTSATVTAQSQTG